MTTRQRVAGGLLCLAAVVGLGVGVAKLGPSPAPPPPKKYGWGGQPVSGGGSGASSVTGANGLTCSPTTGSVVCSGAAFATSASLATVATSGSAADLATGTLPAGRLPAFTGDCTTSAGSSATSCANATATTHGFMAAADKLLMESTPLKWQRERVAFLLGKVPALNKCRYISPGQAPATAALGAQVGDPSVEGGGQSSAGTNRVFGGSVFQLPKTKSWGFCHQASQKVSVEADLGFISAAGTDYFLLSAQSGVDATHLIISIHEPAIAATNVSTSWVLDTAVHNICATYDSGTSTITAWVDDASQGTTTTLTHLRDGPRMLVLYSNTLGDVTTYDIEYCYVSPTAL